MLHIYSSADAATGSWWI